MTRDQPPRDVNRLLRRHKGLLPSGKPHSAWPRAARFTDRNPAGRVESRNLLPRRRYGRQGEKLQVRVLGGFPQLMFVTEEDVGADPDGWFDTGRCSAPRLTRIAFYGDAETVQGRYNLINNSGGEGSLRLSLKTCNRVNRRSQMPPPSPPSPYNGTSARS